MLDSLEIRNYRNLKNIKIPSLGKVNLFTGKNNTGKSSILEAIGIYATKGDLNFIYQLLTDRGEYFKKNESNEHVTLTNLRVLSSLFYERKILFGNENEIFIGSSENSLFKNISQSGQSISLRFVGYIEEIEETNGNEATVKRKIIPNPQNEQSFKAGFQIKIGAFTQFISLDQDLRNRLFNRQYDKNFNLQFIRTRNIDKIINARLWDNIILTEKEEYVIDALKIIEPTTERIAFIEDQTRGRTAVIKLATNTKILPLLSMGDGINRILTIILALVNSDNGVLLIDEFENGLHYTVQEKLWEIIFHLSKQLNIQVFATTHSEDCISGFESILNSSTNSHLGKLIRLDNENGNIKQVEFNAEELEIANRNDIEIR